MDATTSRPRRTREAPQVRRAQILEAANRVFVERGLSAATMDDVAAEAGIAKGTIYLYFPTKEALVAALQAKLVERVTTRARRLADVAPEDAVARLDRFVSGVVDDMLDYAELQHLVFHDAPRHGMVDEAHDLVEQFLEHGRDTGELSVGDVTIAAWFMIDGLLGVLAEATHEPRPGKRAVREAVLEASRRVAGVG